MKQTIFKKIFGAFSLLVIIGAFSICAFMGTMSLNGGDHVMPTNNEMPMTHSLHFEALTSVVDNKTAFAFVSIILPIVFAIVATFHKEDSFLEDSLSRYLRQKFHDILYVVRQTVQHWLSLFEVSPNFQ